MLVSIGCTTRMGDLTVATPKNLPGEFRVVKKGIEGKDCSYRIFFFIPVGIMNPSMDGAVDDALAKVEDADALVDASFFWDRLILLLYNHSCIRVEGTAINTR